MGQIQKIVVNHESCIFELLLPLYKGSDFFPNHHRSITAIQYSLKMTNALSCCCLPHTFNPLSFYEAYLLSSVISIPHAVYLLQSNVFLSHETRWISYTETSLSHETYLIQSTVFLSHKNTESLMLKPLSLMKPISYSQSSFFLMKPTEPLMLKPLSLSWNLSPTVNRLFSHETHWTFYAENTLSWNLSPTVKRLSFSLNPPNLFW
jgi:hypothetical protein